VACAGCPPFPAAHAARRARSRAPRAHGASWSNGRRWGRVPICGPSPGSMAGSAWRSAPSSPAPDRPRRTGRSRCRPRLRGLYGALRPTRVGGHRRVPVELATERSRCPGRLRAFSMVCSGAVAVRDAVVEPCGTRGGLQGVPAAHRARHAPAGVTMPALAYRPPLAATTPRRPGRALCQSPTSPWCRADHGGGYYRGLADHDGRSNMQHPLIWRSRPAWVRREGLAASMRPSRQLPTSGHCWTFGAPNVCSDLADAGRIGRSCP
jgi:hypothetical protein